MKDTQMLKKFVEKFNSEHIEYYRNRISDAEAADWLAENIPLLDCDDPDILETYYFRFWTFRKHIKDTPVGAVITEFLPPVSWSGPYNTISCSMAHHVSEARWLRDDSILESYINFFLDDAHDESNTSYSSSFLWNVFLYCRFSGKLELAKELLPKMIHQYLYWEEQKLTKYGLFWSVDDRDGMEYSISGPGLRPTLNTYMYGAALGIAALCKIFGDEHAEWFRARAEELRANIRKYLWDEKDAFFKTVPMPSKDGEADFDRADPDHNVLEQIGFLPFLVPALTEESDERIFTELMDKSKFLAPYGITTADMTHPRFMKNPVHHECLWDGPVWPFSTAQTLTALYTLLRRKDSAYIGKADYMTLLRQYAASQKLYKDGRLINWIDEDQDPFTGQWIARDLIYLDHAYCFPTERGADYNHSTFCDLVLSGACGILPDTDLETGRRTLTVNPLCVGAWKYFAVENLTVGGVTFDLYYDEDGTKYGFGAGLALIREGEIIARGEKSLTYAI